MELLKKIDFKPEDTLYLLGDAVDRGKHSIKCLRYIMKSPNVHMLLGNHEDMMLQQSSVKNSGLYLKNDEFTDVWIKYNGGKKTIQELSEYSNTEQLEVYNFLQKLPYFFEIRIKNTNFILVHAGLLIKKGWRKLAAEDVLKKQTKENILWIRDDFFNKEGLPGKVIIFGHTPTMTITKRQNEFDIWHDTKYNDKICIDGGCVFGGVLHAICLDTMEEFHVRKGFVSADAPAGG